MPGKHKPMAKKKHSMAKKKHSAMPKKHSSPNKDSLGMYIESVQKKLPPK